MSRRACLLLCTLPATALLNSGCPGKDLVDTTEDTESPYVFEETGGVDESEPLDDTVESLPPEETQPPVETGDTGDPIEPTIADLSLYPDNLAVFPGATWDLRLVAVQDDESSADVEPAKALFASSDEAVATVDADGLVTAVAEGTVEIVAAHGGLEATVLLEVIPPGTAEITVVDAATGLPLETAYASTAESGRVSGDETGLVQVPVEEPGPMVLNAWGADMVPVTIVDTVSRRFTVPVRSQDTVDAEGVTLEGDVDFSSVDAGDFTDVKIGLASASVPIHPLCFDVENLIAEDRIVSIWGVNVELPSNLFVGSYVETWQGGTSAGDFGVWALAGAVPIEEITAGLNGDVEVIDVLVDNLEAFMHDWSGGWTGVNGDAMDVPVAPSVELTDVVQVVAPELSLGFSGDENPLVLITDEAYDGTHAVVGLGQGTGDIEALRIADGIVGAGGASWALAMAQVDGLGSGYGMALSAAPVEAGLAELPPFQTVPVIDSFSGETKEFAIESDERAHIVRVTVRGGDGENWDLYFDSGARSGELSKPQGYTYSWGHTDWTMTAVELSGDTFEGLITRGALTDEELAPTALTAGRMGMHFDG